jgi:hypothetical protein
MTAPTDIVILHVRFAPDGSVTEIAERPVALRPNEWFDRLTGRCGEQFQPLSGGRGVFRIPRGELDALRALPAAA